MLEQRCNCQINRCLEGSGCPVAGTALLLGLNCGIVAAHILLGKLKVFDNLCINLVPGHSGVVYIPDRSGRGKDQRHVTPKPYGSKVEQAAEEFDLSLDLFLERFLNRA